jgi:hypothetical protein
MSPEVFNMYFLRHLTLHSSTFLKIFLEYIICKSPFGTLVSIYSLFDEVISSSGCRGSNDRVRCKWWIKMSEKKFSRHIASIFSWRYWVKP